VRWLQVCPGCPNNPFSITENGTISGNVSTPQGERGFLLSRSGELTYVDTPGNVFIELLRGNNRGQFVGAYFSLSDFLVHGFVRERDGSLTEVTFPDAAVTVTGGITDKREIVGSYTSDATAASGWISFIQRRGAFVETFRYPESRADSTIALGINANAAIVGVFTLSGSSTLHGFKREPDGSYLAIAFPAAIETYLSDINESGAAVGYWRDSAGAYHGLVYRKGLCYTVNPGASPSGFTNTTLTGVNNKGQAVGVSFAQAPGDGDGYLLTRLPDESYGAAPVPGVDCAVPYKP
jgi:hypothetical protein